MVLRFPLLDEDKKYTGMMVIRKEDFRSAYQEPKEEHTVIHFFDSITDSIVSGITSLSPWEITEAMCSDTPPRFNVPLKHKLREDRIKPSYELEGMSEQESKEHLLMLFNKALNPREISTNDDYIVMARIILALKGDFNAYAEFPYASQHQIDYILQDIRNAANDK